MFQLNIVDSRYHWVICYHKWDAAYVACVAACVAIAENVKFVDCVETDDDYVMIDDD